MQHLAASSSQCSWLYPYEVGKSRTPRGWEVQNTEGLEVYALLSQQEVGNIDESVFKSFPGVYQTRKKHTFAKMTVQIVRYIERIDVKPSEQRTSKNNIPRPHGKVRIVIRQPLRTLEVAPASVPQDICIKHRNGSRKGLQRGRGPIASPFIIEYQPLNRPSVREVESVHTTL